MLLLIMLVLLLQITLRRQSLSDAVANTSALITAAHSPCQFFYRSVLREGKTKCVVVELPKNVNYALQDLH